MWKCHIFFRRWNFFAVRVLDLSVFLVWTHPTIFLTDDKAHSERLHLVYVYLYNHGSILCEHLLYKHLFTKYREVNKEWVGRFGAQAHLHPVRKKFSSNAICSKFPRWTFLVQIIELSQPAMLLLGPNPVDPAHGKPSAAMLVLPKVLHLYSLWRCVCTAQKNMWEHKIKKFKHYLVLTGIETNTKEHDTTKLSLSY